MISIILFQQGLKRCTEQSIWQEAHAKITEADMNSGYSTPQGNGELPEITPEAPNSAMVALGSTGEHDSEDNTGHCGDESDQDKSREKTANSNLESASGNCLTCLDTEEVAVRTS